MEKNDLNELYFETSYQIIKGDVHMDQALRVAQFTEAQCESCGSKLCNILKLDLSDERLQFLWLKGKLHNTICLSCMDDKYKVHRLP